MKPMIGVGVFGKQDMISWMLDGIASAFQTGNVVFFFEACRDLSKQNFLQLAPEKIGRFDWSYGESDSHVLEHGVHNWLIQQFMASDCDVLIIPHDDNKFVGSRLLHDILRVFDEFGDKTGWISGRDGYEAGYGQMISSPFSASNIARKKLKIGEFQPRSQMNTGPVVYSRRLIDAIGGPSMEYEGWFWWDDYSLTSKRAGFQNVILGMDCLHEKFGALQNNCDLYDNVLVARDLDRLQKKWRPILGYNPI